MIESPPRRNRSAPLLPPQHGAWAFLGLPVATAVTVAPSSALVAVLAVTWICAYPASYFVLALVRDSSSRRPDPRRFRRPLVIWGAAALIGGTILLVARPWLVWVALAYGVGFAVNVAFARRRDERALANDAVFIAQCAAMVPVTWAVASGGVGLTPPLPVPATVWTLTVAVALLLVGSTLHVKSLIRERADPRFRAASRAVAVASLLASIGLAASWGLPAGLWLCLPFAYFAARSLLMRGPAPRPGRIGGIELVGFVLLVAASTAAATRWSA